MQVMRVRHPAGAKGMARGSGRPRRGTMRVQAFLKTHEVHTALRAGQGLLLPASQPNAPLHSTATRLQTASDFYNHIVDAQQVRADLGDGVRGSALALGLTTAKAAALADAQMVAAATVIKVLEEAGWAGAPRRPGFFR